MKFGMLLIACFMVLVTFSSALAVPEETENQGIPQRVAIVEKVLEVEKLTKQPTAEVLGTDYLPYDIGKLQAYLKVGEYPLESAVCHVSVLYPDMTYFLENQLMMASTQKYFEGLYYLDFVVPNVTGVYPVNAICFYEAETIVGNAVNSYSDIPLGQPKGITIDNSLLSDTYELDGITMNLKGEGDCNNYYCNHTFDFDLPIGWHTDTISDHRIIIQLEQDNDDEVKEFYVQANGDTYHWFNLTDKNIIHNYQFDLNDSFDNITDYAVIVRSYDWDGGKIKIDYLATSRTYNGSYVSDLRGNNELVVSEKLNNLTVTVNNFVESEIEVVSSEQLGEFILIVGFLILLFTGLVTASAVIGLAYSFIYLDGLLAIGGAVICAVMIYADRQRKKK